MNTLVTTNTWETGSCDTPDTFACEIEPGKTIHSVPKPTEPYHCPSPEYSGISFKLNPESQKCYSFPKTHPDGLNMWNSQPFAKEFCANYSSQLLTIHSEQEQNFISKNLVSGSWLNLHLNTVGDIPAKWDDGSDMDFVNWMESKLHLQLKNTKDRKTNIFIFEIIKNIRNRKICPFYDFIKMYSMCFFLLAD
jgi:hypothetical protein